MALSHTTSRRAVWVASALTLVAAVVVISCSKTTSTATPVVTTTINEAEPVGPPLFDDVTNRCGIDFTYRNGEDAGNFAIIESLGGGVALLDFDRDGRLDIFFPGGGRYEAKKVLGQTCRLYRNLGDWKFEDVTSKVGLAGEFQYTHGAAAFDYDNDGWIDLLLTGYNRLFLLHNESSADGGRKFVDVTAKAGLNDNRWSSCAGWGDLDGDGFPEIYVSHYGDWGFDTNHPTDCYYDGKTRDVCQPRRFKPFPHTLYRNNKNGTFTDISDKLIPKSLGRGMGVLFLDADGDSRTDIYVANDTDDNHLYMNRGKPGEISLEEVGIVAGVARDERGNANGSMGVDAGDFDRSGRPSIIVTNYEGELPALYHNRSAKGKERFTYGTLYTGISVVTGAYVGWGTGFLDYDHDGWEDLMMVNGHAIRYPSKTDRRQKPILFRNEGSEFKLTTSQGGTYFHEPHNARGAAFGDLDNDGKVDVVISHLNEPVTVLRNVAPTDGRKWVGIELFGKDNRDLVSARVVLESAGGKQTRFVKGGGSFGCTNDRRLVFGLGGDTKIDKVTVYWPGGSSSEHTGVAPDGYWRIVEGQPAAERTDGARK